MRNEDDLAEVLRQIKELLTDNTLAGTKRLTPRQRRGPERRGDRRCWKCGGLGHISRECQASSRDARASEVSATNRTLPVVVIRSPEIETPIVEGSVGGVGCDMLVDTGSAVTLADERIMRHSKTMRDVPKPLIRLETASGTELEITNACVTEIVLGKSVTVQHTVLCVRELSHKILLGWDFMRYHGCTPDPTAGCLRMRQGNIPFLKSHAVAPVRAESPQSELMAHQPAHEAMEKMLSSEQESSGKHRSALAAILREFADVLSASDEDPGRTSVVRHAIYTVVAKPVRCSPTRIPYHQRAQVETLLGEMLRRDVVEPSTAAEQPQTEGFPLAPEDLLHFGRAGGCTMVFGPGPGKRILAVQSDALWTVQRTGHPSEAHGDIPERPGGLRLLGAPGRCHRIWQDYRRTYGTTTRGVPPPLGSGIEGQSREMPAHEEEGGVLGPHHFGKRDCYGPKQNLCRVGVAGTDLRHSCGISSAACWHGHSCAAGKDPRGNRCVLVLMDYFTKWTAVFSLANMEARTVAKVLDEEYIAYFGAPDYLLCDQGRSFEASVVLQICRLFDIKTPTFPYHPQRNGQAERFNRTLLGMLSILVNGNSGYWDNMLPFVMLAYNSSVHESTGVTPAIAMLGRELRLPLDVQIGNPPGREAQGLPDYITGYRLCLLKL
ncbi:Retrovirus-related Pol polyprotein from transposon [Trichinella patagoniensis]|uniref:Retrovirus-related Pol polyprotein from transposon n=1 Tax=Trichinella patagoniensis TaxID=990121 RepID=A0A0V0ZDS1_9BILA|nr:Retrovirus-related Pol polyprotein from transposon [Trichinella patagoniensis]